MKKAVGYLCVIALCFTLTGCIDILQHITRLSNGTIQNTVKITVSKAIFEMAAEMSGEPADYDEFFNESGLDEIISEYNQFSAIIKKIEDPLDIGYFIDMNINYRDPAVANKINQENSPFIPKISGNLLAIHIDGVTDESGPSEDNEYAAAITAAAKYRILLSKSVVNRIRRVIIKSSEGEEDYPFIDLYDEYLIEIPIPILYMSSIDLEIYS